MESSKPHFPLPKKNFYNEKYQPTGFGKPVIRQDYTSHGKRLREQASTVKKELDAKTDAKVVNYYYFMVRTPKDYPFKTRQQNLRNLGFEIVSYKSNVAESGIVGIKKSEFEVLENKIATYCSTPKNVGKSNLASLETLVPIPIEDKIDFEINKARSKEVDVSITLFDNLSQTTGNAIFNVVKEELGVQEGVLSFYRYLNGMTVISGTLPVSKIKDIAKTFSTVKSISLNSTLHADAASTLAPLPGGVSIDPPLSNSAVCVIDSGIKSDNPILGGLIKERIVKLPAGSVDCEYGHGTFVASRCLFGDVIADCNTSKRLTPHFKILDVAIFGVDVDKKKVNPSPDFAFKVIEEVVSKYHKEIMIYNISFGLENNVVTDHEFSKWAGLLDFLAKEFQVLFIIAAGNINTLLGNYPVGHFRNPGARIISPAESLLSISVGAIAKRVLPDTISKKNELSPFSRIGPGADMGVKPELVCHGGNYVKPYGIHKDAATFGICQDGLNFSLLNGTSFSAPIVANYAQRLKDYYSTASPNLIKAFLLHFAEMRTLPKPIVTPVAKYVGYGEPNIESAFSASSNNAVFYGEHTLEQENFQYVRFHVPSAFLEKGKAKEAKIRVTLVYDPPVNVANSMEYSQTKILAALIKNTATGKKDVQIDAEDKSSLPWNPIVKLEKTFKRGFISGEWELRLKLLTRGTVPKTYKQKYAVIIEVLDPNSKLLVHDSVLSEFSSTYKPEKMQSAA